MSVDPNKCAYMLHIPLHIHVLLANLHFKGLYQN